MSDTTTLSYSLSSDNWIAIAGIVITIVGGLVFLIFRSGTVVEKINNVETRLSKVEIRLDGLWERYFSVNKSPVQLNDNGLKVLEDSGIKKIVEDRFKIIVDKVKEKNPQNAYQAQEFVKNIVEDFKNDISLKNILENGAFKSGVDVFTILFVGAIYIRDKVLIQVGFNIDDIDKFQPKTTP